MKKIKSHPEKSPTTGESRVARSSQKAPSHLCQPTRHHSPTWTHPDSPACCLNQSAKRRQSSLLSVLPAIPFQSLPGGGPWRENGHRGMLNITRSPDPSPDVTSHLGGHEACGAARGEAGNCRGNDPEDTLRTEVTGQGRPEPRPGRGRREQDREPPLEGFWKGGHADGTRSPSAGGKRPETWPQGADPPEHTPAARTQSGASWASPGLCTGDPAWAASPEPAGEGAQP